MDLGRLNRGVRVVGAVLALWLVSSSFASARGSWPPNSVIVSHLHCCLPQGSSIQKLAIRRRGTIVPPRQGKLFGQYFAPGTILYVFTATFTQTDTGGDYVNYIWVPKTYKTPYRENYIVYRNPLDHGWEPELLSATCSGTRCPYPGGNFGANTPFSH